jgi:hypothetical protein
MMEATSKTSDNLLREQMSIYPRKRTFPSAIASPLWAKSRHIQTKFQRSPRMAGLFGTFWPHPRQILRHVRKCASAFYPSPSQALEWHT